MATESGKLVLSYRKSSGLSQLEVSKQLRYTTSQFISNWERGLAGVPPRVAKRLCKVLGIPVNEMVTALEKDALKKVHRELRCGR